MKNYVIFAAIVFAIEALRDMSRVPNSLIREPRRLWINLSLVGNIGMAAVGIFHFFRN